MDWEAQDAADDAISAWFAQALFEATDAEMTGGKPMEFVPIEPIDPARIARLLARQPRRVKAWPNYPPPPLSEEEYARTRENFVSGRGLLSLSPPAEPRRSWWQRLFG